MEKLIYFQPREVRDAEKQKRVDKLYDAMDEFRETLKRAITNNDERFKKN